MVKKINEEQKEITTQIEPVVDVVEEQVEEPVVDVVETHVKFKITNWVENTKIFIDGVDVETFEDFDQETKEIEVEKSEDYLLEIKTTDTNYVLYSQVCNVLKENFEFVIDSNLFSDEDEDEDEDVVTITESSLGESIEAILVRNNYYNHIPCGRYFQGVGLTNTSLLNFYKEFEVYIQSKDDIELFGLLQEFLVDEELKL